MADEGTSDSNGTAEKVTSSGSDSTDNVTTDGTEDLSKETNVVINVESNGSKKIASKESWFDVLVREMSGTKVLDRSKIDQCFDHFKSSGSTEKNTVEGLTFDDFGRLLNELFVDHGSDNRENRQLDNHSRDGSVDEEMTENENEVVVNVNIDLKEKVTVATFKSFYIPKSYYIELFQKFDRNRDNVIDRREFNAMWGKWIQIILKPKATFIIVDVQNDFIDGSLAIARCPAGKYQTFFCPIFCN